MLTGPPICCAPVGDRCGEGVLWVAAEKAIYWTDINRFLIHRYDTKDEAVRSWFFEEPVTSVLLTDADELLCVCLGSKVILWKPKTDYRSPMGFGLPDWPKTRLNDAGIDPAGRLFAGSMRNNVNPDGSPGEEGGRDGVLYRVEHGGSVAELDREIGISNTVCWSPDAKYFYFGDSPANVIWRYSYDSASGEVRKLGNHFDDFPRGLPDGSAIDKDGYLWNCRYGGGCIVRVSANGKVDQTIEMPVKNITNCTFGGDDLNVLYVTTAASSERLSGSLFKMETQVQGVPENRLKLSADTRQLFA